MKHNLTLLITAHFLTTASCTAMESVLTKPKFCLFYSDTIVIVAGDNGWTFFDTTQKAHTKINEQKIQALGINENIAALVTGKNKDTLDIYTITEEGALRAAWKFESHSKICPITVSNHTVFAYHKDEIKAYDYRDKTRHNIKVPYHKSATIFPRISCHPTKTEIIYPSSQQTLSIVQPYSEPLIKAHLTIDLCICTGGEYNPNGTMLALNNHHCRYFIYNEEMRDSFAYELGTDNKKYISLAFHPHYYTLLLLSEDNSLECWDYLRRTLLFTTHPLAKTNYAITEHCALSKRLAFSHDGTQLLVALEDEWKIITIPQNNLLVICWLLYKNNLPNNLKNIIVRTIIGNTPFSQLNLAELSTIATLPPIRGGVDLSTQAEKPTENIKITAVYQNKQS